MTSHLRSNARAASALLLVAGLAAPLVAADPVAALPASTLAYVSIDVGRAVREVPNLELVKLYRDEEVHDFLTGATSFVMKETRQLRAGLKLLEMYGLPDIVAGKVVVALVGFGRAPEMGAAGAIEWGAPLERDRPFSIGDVVMIVETSGRESFGETLERAFELVPEERVTDAVAHASFAHEVTRFPRLGPAIPGLSHGFVGDTFVATLNPARYVEVAQAVAAGTRENDPLTGDGTYAAWRAAAPRGTGVLDIYVGGHALWKVLEPAMEYDVTLRRCRDLGVTAIDGLGVSIGVERGRIRDSIAVVTGQERPGLLGLLDAFTSGTIASEVPGAADLAIAANVDWMTLLDRTGKLLETVDPPARRQMDDRIASVGALLGVDLRRDLLTGLGDRLQLWLAAKNGPIPIPDGGGSLALRDGAKIGEILEGLLGGVDLGGELGLRPFEIEGATTAFYATGGLPVQPALAVMGDRLVVASSPPLLKRQLTSGGDGDGEDGLRDEDDFVRCMAHNVGQSDADVVALVYLDVPHVTEYGLGFVGPFLPMAALQAPFYVDPSLMPFPDTVASYLSGYLLTVRKTDRVIALDASSPFGGLVVAAALAAVVVPQVVPGERVRPR